MYFDVSAGPAEMSALFNQFVAITGVEPWARKEDKFKKQLQDDPFLEGYLNVQFALEHSILRVQDYRRSTGRMPALDSAEIGYLYSFIAITARVFHRLPPEGKKALRKAIIGALKSDIGIAPLAFEMRTAAHFMSMGANVEFHDLCGSGGYDLLIDRGRIEVEVECKSVSADLGRPIHLLRQYQLGKYIRSEIEAQKEAGTIQLLVATLPEKLHGRRDFMEAIAERIRMCLQTRNNIDSDTPCAVSYHRLTISGSPFDGHSPARIREQEVIDYCAQATGENIGHVLLMFRPRSYATIIAIRSRQPNQPLKGIDRTLRDAAKRQLSGVRPGIICVQFRSLTTNEILELASTPNASGRPTGLQVMTSKFFASNSYQHVRTIAYVAPGNFIQNQRLSRDVNSTDLIRTTDIREDAASYTFTNPKNPTAGDARYQFF